MCLNESFLEVDHVKAIALGGDQWDIDNLRTLCYRCHKEKTKKDLYWMAVAKMEGKLFAQGQRKIGMEQEK